MYSLSEFSTILLADPQYLLQWPLQSQVLCYNEFFFFKLRLYTTSVHRCPSTLYSFENGFKLVYDVNSNFREGVSFTLLN